jgi:hypothetical protein
MRIRIHKVIESGSNPDPDADPQPWKTVKNFMIQWLVTQTDNF